LGTRSGAGGLTERYALPRDERRAWEHQLKTLPVAEAVARAHRNLPAAALYEVLAAHTLMPELRRELDDTEGLLLEAAQTKHGTWPQIGVEGDGQAPDGCGPASGGECGGHGAPLGPMS
jgi:hypothetical protein